MDGTHWEERVQCILSEQGLKADSASIKLIDQSSIPSCMAFSIYGLICCFWGTMRLHILTTLKTPSYAQFLKLFDSLNMDDME